MLNPSWNERGVVQPPLRNFFYNSRTTKAFNFKFWPSAQNLSGRVCAKFQGHMTPTYDVIATFWQAPPQKMAILVYFLNFNNSFDTNGITMKLYACLNNTSNWLGKKIWWRHHVCVYFTDQNMKNWNKTDFEWFWPITFSQNNVIKKSYFWE